MPVARIARRLVVLLVAVATTAAAHSRMDAAAKGTQGDVFVPRPAQARVSTLGFDALVSDYYWLRAVQIVGRERRGLGERSGMMARLIDLVTTLDPWVGHPYRFAAIWLVNSVDEVRAANRLLERSIAYHPRDWRNRHYLGFNYFFYLGDDSRAADWIETAVGLPHAPHYLGGLVAKLRLERDGLETAGAFVASLAESTDDEYARAAYLKALDEIETERRARRLDVARAEYRRRHGRDITRPEDLLRGPNPLLSALPQAHPHFPQFRWEIDPETNEIVSSFYGFRYSPRIQASDRQRREQWRRQVEAEAEAS